MRTSKFQQHIPSLHNGISRQSPTVRFANQVSDARNVQFSITDGAVKRPGYREFTSWAASNSLINGTRIHKIERDANEQYLVVYGKQGSNMVLDVIQVDNPRNRRAWLLFPAGAGYYRLYFNGAYSANIYYDSAASVSTNYAAMQVGLNGMTTIGTGYSVATANTAGTYIIDLDDNLPGADLISATTPTSGTALGGISRYGTKSRIIIDAASQTYLNAGNSTADSLRFITITDTTIIANKNVAVSCTDTSYSKLSPTSMPIKMVRTSLNPPTFSVTAITYAEAKTNALEQKITVYNGAAITVYPWLAQSGTTGIIYQSGIPLVASPDNTAVSLVRNAINALVGSGNVDVIKVDNTYTVFLTESASNISASPAAFPNTNGLIRFSSTTAIGGTASAVINSEFVYKKTQAPTPMRNQGYGICDIIYHRGRLGFAMEEWVVFSQPDDLFNFYPEENDQLDASDPIALQIGADAVSKISYLVPFRKGVLIMTESGRQFDLGAGDVFTAENATFTPSTRYISQPTRPTTVGATIYFAGSRENSTPIWEYVYDEFALTNKATNVTTHVADLIPQSVRSIVSSDNNNTVIVLPTNLGSIYSNKQAYSTGYGAVVPVDMNWSDGATWNEGHPPAAGTNVSIAASDTVVFDGYEPVSPLYVYKKYESGGELLQSAWGIYEFDEDQIEDIAIVNDTLYIVMHTETNYPQAVATYLTLNVLPLTQIPTPPGSFEYQPRMDKRLVQQSKTYIGDATYYKYEVESGGANKVIIMENGNWVEYNATPNNYGSVYITGDKRAFQAVIGRPVKMELELSQVYARDAQGSSIINGTLEISKTIIDHRQSGSYSVTASSKDREIRTTTFQPTENIDETGKMTAWTMGRSDDLVIKITSNSPKPIAITSVEYHGRNTVEGYEEESK